MLAIGATAAVVIKAPTSRTRAIEERKSSRRRRAAPTTASAVLPKAAGKMIRAS